MRAFTPEEEPPISSAGRQEESVADDHHDRSKLRGVVRVLLIAFVILALVRVFVFEPYGIPTGSMKPTILEGDVLLVDKLPYRIRSLRYIPFTNIAIPYLDLPGIGSLERGDVVMFDLPGPPASDPREKEDYLKRCVAIAGDTIQLVEGRIRVNGIEVPPVDPENDGADYHRRSPISTSRVFPLLRAGGRLIVPFKGYDVFMDSTAAERWRTLLEGEGISVEYRNRIVFLDGLPATHYTFHRDYFFAVGDNSANSYDSRFFGFIPYDNLVGRATIIYWSREPDDGIRWDRIGKVIR
jgi:signal peptidase I